MLDLPKDLGLPGGIDLPTDDGTPVSSAKSSEGAESCPPTEPYTYLKLIATELAKPENHPAGLGTAFDDFVEHKLGKYATLWPETIVQAVGRLRNACGNDVNAAATKVEHVALIYGWQQGDAVVGDYFKDLAPLDDTTLLSTLNFPALGKADASAIGGEGK